MRKVVVTAFAVVTLAIACYALAAPALAQNRVRVARAQDVLTFAGSGAAIGVSVRDLSTEEASKTDLSSGGVMIDSVREGTPAARAGFRAGDVVIEFDGERIRSARHFTRLVQETRPGRSVRATVVRDGSRQTLDVTPEARTLSDFGDVLSREIQRGVRSWPRNFTFDFDFDLPRNRLQLLTRGNLGATLSQLNPQLAGYFGVREGVLVESVETNSRAADAGLKAGDVITSAGGRAVQTPADVSQAVRSAAPGSSVELRIIREKKELMLEVPIPERTVPTTTRPRLPV